MFIALGFSLILTIVSGRSAVAISTTNLTSIKWAHAVNSQALLEQALGSDVDMLEADIVLGVLVSNPSAGIMPVMGHPPAISSDISLEMFLQQVLDYNHQNVHTEKGVKLDFKSTAVFEGSLAMLESFWSLMTYPCWLNADITPGPVNNTATKPVDPNAFFGGSKTFSSAVLSTGWTTLWGPNFNEGHYTDFQIDAIHRHIQFNAVTQELTFPVRAGIAAQSLPQMKKLLQYFDNANRATLTIWSSANDRVDIGKLRELIFTVGLDRVYLDVPAEVSSQLHLDKPINGPTDRMMPNVLLISPTFH